MSYYFNEQCSFSSLFACLFLIKESCSISNLSRRCKIRVSIIKSIIVFHVGAPLLRQYFFPLHREGGAIEAEVGKLAPRPREDKCATEYTRLPFFFITALRSSDSGIYLIWLTEWGLVWNRRFINIRTTQLFSLFSSLCYVAISTTPDQILRYEIRLFYVGILGIFVVFEQFSSTYNGCKSFSWI